MIAIRVGERYSVGSPVGIRRLDGVCRDALDDLIDGLRGAEIEDEQRLWMWWRCFVVASASGELEMRVAPG